MEYKRLSKAALKCRYVVAVITEIFVTALILLGYSFTKEVKVVVMVELGIWICTMIYMVFMTYFNHINYKYCITDECIDIREGYFFTTRTVVPIERLHKLEISEGIVGKRFKVSDITITTAGGDVKLDYVDSILANEIVENLNARINSIVLEQRSKAINISKAIQSNEVKETSSHIDDNKENI